MSLPSYPAHLSAATAKEAPHRPHLPGTDGLAVASLVLGVFGFIPLVNVLAIVFGILALNRLRSVEQRGRGYAIGGLCAAGAWIVLLIALTVLFALR